MSVGDLRNNGTMPGTSNGGVRASLHLDLTRLQGENIPVADVHKENPVVVKGGTYAKKIARFIVRKQKPPVFSHDHSDTSDIVPQVLLKTEPNEI